MNILKEYQRIMKAEDAIRTARGLPKFALTLSPIEIRWKAEQMMALAKNSLTPRSHARDYDLWFSGDASIDNSHTLLVPLGVTMHTPVMLDVKNHDQPFVHESVAGHTNLLQQLIRSALFVRYGDDFGEPDGAHPRTEDGYSFIDISEAIRLHDLPENEYGDWRDNGNIDAATKESQEWMYWQSFCDKYTRAEAELKLRAERLLRQKELADTPTARMFHAGDKAAAPIMMLTYDDLGRNIILPESKAQPGSRDLTEMKLCDWSYAAAGDIYYRASEMWTIDFFELRRFTEIDDTGFFTALLVMTTLLVNDHWYTWREETYTK